MGKIKPRKKPTEDYILYKNKKCPVRMVYVEGWSENEKDLLTISNDTIHGLLIDDNGEPRNKDAEMVDCQIFFYVDNEEFKLSDEQLSKVVEESIN